jgi:NAD(P)-dependent dehydrogenase (short-subunit alcohol dehydrogenase family)
MGEARHSKSLMGEVALVTGASSGLGAQFARLLASHGAQVAIAARRVERLETLAAALSADGADVLPVAMDVADEASIQSAYDQVQARFGPPSIVVNNAGMNARGLAVDISAADFDQVFNVNVRGVFLVAREGARRMIAARQAGRIVNIASMAALKVLPGLTAYCASKAAVAHMTKSLAREWARQNINVNAICPGYIETEINSEWLTEEAGQKMIQGFPRRRVMPIEALDQALLYLASPQSHHVTGAVLAVDDGQSL